MGDDTDVTSQKYSFTRILQIINGIYTCVKLHFFFEITSILASTITKKNVICFADNIESTLFLPQKFGGFSRSVYLCNID